MINVNGKEFETIDQAIAFMQDEKKKEESASYERIISEFLDNTDIAKVVRGGRTYYIAVAISSKKRPLYLRAQVEALFGLRYDISDRTLRELYQVHTLTSDEKESVKSAIAEHVKLCKEKDMDAFFRIRIKNEDLAGTIFLYNYDYKKEQEHNSNGGNANIQDCPSFMDILELFLSPIYD